jgi:PHP family Zn ribbon phosphoesterase
VIPAHVDRSVDSVISQLGWLPPELGVDAVELSRFGAEEDLAPEHPWLTEVPVVRFSDAHLPEDIGYQQTRFHLAEPTVAELRLALQGRDGRWHQPLRQALRAR